MIDIVTDTCAMNFVSDSAREFRLKTYTLYVSRTINIVRSVQIASVIF